MTMQRFCDVLLVPVAILSVAAVLVSALWQLQGGDVDAHLYDVYHIVFSALAIVCSCLSARLWCTRG